MIVVLALATITGCAKRKPRSGLLGESIDYPHLKPGPKGGIDLVYFKGKVDFRPYKKIMMDHVVFYMRKDAKYKGIYSHELEKLAEDFHNAFADALGGRYPLVDKPGPDVLRIRVAITDIVLSRPALNTFTAIMPIGLGISFIKKGITGSHAYVGEASMEFEALDSQTNERLAAGIDTKPADKYKIIKGLSKFGHIKDAFEFWAERLRSFLDGVHDRE